MTGYQKHLQNWRNCTLCYLSKTRTRMVFARGQLPCDVLFIGEAPGHGEDIIGQPFVGPAGKLLDEIIAKAKAMLEARNLLTNFTVGFTNLVCCIPLGEDGAKTAEPDEGCIRACTPRLKNLIEISMAQLVVCVGSTAAKSLRKHRAGLGLGDIKLLDIIHPAAILRGNISQRGLSVQKAVITLATAFEELIPF